ncbi:unnamed protein product [Cylindrotheca closterium]|uniref:NAD(P)-binding domain-containing protein n=1 Tax=Cylindrotheca closterium TaxID=2856 RepID=A0AAD2FNX8_9STRA|nr:unnamed protein product [Cylindrotheca closterium]
MMMTTIGMYIIPFLALLLTLDTTNGFLSSSIGGRYSSTVVLIGGGSNHHKNVVITSSSSSSSSSSLASSQSNDEDEAARLKKKAEELRDQIRNLEENLDRKPGNEYYRDPMMMAATTTPEEEAEQGMSLKKRRVLVVGANGRLGSMVCRHLLRNNPQTEVVACVHYVGEDSPTSRGYARLSYEVGAEDGVGSIGSAWSGEDRVATFEYADYMKDYNLQNLRLVECELLDPVQCQTICEGVDSVVWCATDFNGNQPRALGLNFAFLFRAVAAPTKGRVEVEGLRNMLGALKLAKQDAADRPSMPKGGKPPINFVHVSAAPNSLADFETPFGTFHGQKREGEVMVSTEFPSLSHIILQMSTFDDNFVEEGKEIVMEETGNKEFDGVIKRQRINRRDAARAVSEALTNEDMEGKMFQLYTDQKVLK